MNAPRNRKIKKAPVAVPVDPKVRAANMRALARKVGTALAVGAFGAASLGAAWGAHRYVTTSERFSLREVIVHGAHVRTAHAIVAKSAVILNDNVFAVDLDKARASLLSDPWIRDALFVRRLPDKIEIRVTEQQPAAIVLIDTPYLATREGEIFKSLEAGDPADLPMISGITVDQISEDRSVVTGAITRAIEVAADYRSTVLAHRFPLRELRYGDSGEITLVVGSEAMEVNLGAGEFHRKIAQTARVVADLDKRSVVPSAIMVDNPARPDRVVVRVR